MRNEDFYQRKFVILDTISENDVLRIFKDFPILPSSEIFYFVNFDDEILAKQIYRVSMDSPLIEEIYGKYYKKWNFHRSPITSSPFKTSSQYDGNTAESELGRHQQRHIAASQRLSVE